MKMQMGPKFSPLIALYCLCILTTCYRTALAATTYYVSSQNGDDDSNNGLSLQNAFQTIKHASQQVVPGDTVLIRGGTYAGEKLNLEISGM